MYFQGFNIHQFKKSADWFQLLDLTLQTHSKTYCLRYASLYSYLCILSYKLSIELHVVTL